MKAGTAGGIEAVVKAINTRIDNADVCLHGCAALCVMAVNNGKNETTKNKTKQHNQNEMNR